MKIIYYLKCACICSKTANLLTTTQLKHYIEWKRLRQWRIRLHTKLIMKFFSEMDQSAKSCCQTVECKRGVLLMVDTEWLQTCPIPSKWSQGKIFILRPSLPAQALPQVTEVANGTFQLTLKEIPSPCGILIRGPSWICSMKNVSRSSATSREWWERKMCLRLPFKIWVLSRSFRLIERTC